MKHFFRIWKICFLRTNSCQRVVNNMAMWAFPQHSPVFKDVNELRLELDVEVSMSD